MAMVAHPPVHETLVAAPGGHQAEASLRANFFHMSLCFAIVHGVCTTPLVVASSFLPEHTAYVGSGVFYIAAMLGALLIAAPACEALGVRRAMVLGGALWCVYVGGFGLALEVGPGSVQTCTFIASSAAGGVAGAIIWVAQGIYFAVTGDQLAAATGQTAQECKMSLAGLFSTWFLLFEVVSKVGFSLMQVLPLGLAKGSFVYFCIGVASVFMLSRIQDLKTESTGGNPIEQIVGVASLWSDPLVWLLSPMNITFGFCAAFMNGYVNAVFLKPEVGVNLVAAVGAIVPLVGAAASKVFAYVGATSGRAPVITIGAICFLLIPGFFLLFDCCSGWGARILFLYVLQGLGRAVFESTNRAAFADFFADDTQNAFANCALQLNFAFAISFFMQASFDRDTLAMVILVLAACTPLCYSLASFMLSAKLSAEKLLV